MLLHKVYTLITAVCSAGGIRVEQLHKWQHVDCGSGRRPGGLAAACQEVLRQGRQRQRAKSAEFRVPRRYVYYIMVVKRHHVANHLMRSLGQSQGIYVILLLQSPSHSGHLYPAPRVILIVRSHRLTFLWMTESFP